jgi:hypothetical protein
LICLKPSRDETGSVFSFIYIGIVRNDGGIVNITDLFDESLGIVVDFISRRFGRVVRNTRR